MKKLGLFIVVVLIFGASLYYLYGNQFKKTNQNPQGVTSSVDKTAILEIVDSFYKDYDSCMKNPPAAAAGQVSIYCQGNTGLTTTAFIINLEKGGTSKAGADPIFCAQNIPESVNVISNAQIIDDKANVFVNEKFGPREVKIKVSLVKNNDAWKIDNAICPLP